MREFHGVWLLVLAVVAFGDSAPARAEEPSSGANPDVELAKKSQNPVGDLISVPFENNFDGGFGPKDALIYTLNLKPVYPLTLGEDWTLINRLTLPIIHQGERVSGEGNKFGLGDSVYQAFFSPKDSPVIWGAGPAFLFPTHTSPRLGNDKWGVGPTAVLLAKPGPWLVGGLVQHLWSFAGSGDGVSLSSAQYFVNYNFGNGWYLTSTPTMTANWKKNAGDTWTIPVGGGIGNLLRIGGAPVDIKLQGFGYPERPTGGPDWSVQLTFKLLFPK
ncbi:MAG: hypothetical protein JRH01_14325 [Deltaproteobacteria bacterium]|nr:hypothetical protein [Deltaproteobacteria bacterium]